MEWYVLHVKTGKELSVKKLIQQHLGNLMYRTIVPRRMLTERRQSIQYEEIRPLFPGYVFIEIEMNYKYYYMLKEIPDIYKILSNDSYYSKIDYWEMYPILTLISEGEVINYSKIIDKDSKQIVDSGPLKGLEKAIRKIDKRKKRAKVVLNFMGQQREVYLGIELQKDR